MERAAYSDGDRPRVLIVGAGAYFLSGISYYTNRLARAISKADAVVSVVLMRRLIPDRLYPGRKRIGSRLSAFSYPEDISVYDGIDWNGTGLLSGIRFLRRQRPEFVVFQWWTGAVLHSFLFLAVTARLCRAKIIVEFHEAQDVGEMRIPLARTYVNLLLPALLRLSNAAVVHSEYDLALVCDRHGLGLKPVATIPHGPYDDIAPVDPTIVAGRPEGCREILWFGVLRPFKGVEDLVAAFDSLSEVEVESLHLTLVGEVWEGHSLPYEAAACSRHSRQISVVDRYVTDEELAGFLSRAAVVALPYRRSSSSGPLSMAMAYGLPVIVSEVGGLVEAAKDYEGTTFVPSGDVSAVADALRSICGSPPPFDAPTSWHSTATAFLRLFDDLTCSTTGVID